MVGVKSYVGKKKLCGYVGIVMVEDRHGEVKIVTIKEAPTREAVPQNRCSLREAVQMELLSGILREWE